MQTKLSTSKLNKRLLLVAGSLTIVIASAPSASAFLNSNTVGNVLNQAQAISPGLQRAGVNIQPSLNRVNQYVQSANDYWTLISNFYQQLVAGNLLGILGSVRGITGALGIPDPLQVLDLSFANGQIAQDRANAANNQSVFGIASTVLGIEGQTMLRSGQQQSAILAAQSYELATQAQGFNVTQQIEQHNAMLLANMSQQMQKVSDLQTAELLQVSASNIALSNISTNLAYQKQRQEQEAQARLSSERQASSQIFIPGISLANDQTP